MLTKPYRLIIGCIACMLLVGEGLLIFKNFPLAQLMGIIGGIGIGYLTVTGPKCLTS